MKLATVNPVDETPDRPFNGPAFASAVRELVPPAAGLLTLEQTMAALQLGERTVHAARRGGILKAAKTGHGKTAPWRFSSRSVAHLADNPQLLNTLKGAR